MRLLLVLLVLGCALPAPALAAGDGGAKQFFWQVLNLVMLLAVLFVFARKPIQGFFRERRDRIQTDVETAARMRQEAEERHAQLQRQLAELDSELTRIRTTARERAESDRERILADARTSAERVRQDSRLAIDQELRRALDELRREAADLSVEMAAELLRSGVSDADRERLLDEFIGRVESAATNGSGR